MASLTQWTWVWVNSGSWWWTRRLGVLQSMGSQRIGHNWATELNWTDGCIYICVYLVTPFIVAINLCLYIGPLQFCGIFLFFLFSFFFSFSPSFFIILINHFLNLFYFSTIIALFAFPTALFPLQLIFNVYESASSTSI